MPNSPKRNNRRNSKERRDSKKRQQQRGNMKGGSSATGIDNHMKEILGEYKLAVPQPSQSENAFGSRYDVGKLALTGGSRKNYNNRQRGGAAIDGATIQGLFNATGDALSNEATIDTWLGTATNYGDTIQNQLLSLEMIRNGTDLVGNAIQTTGGNVINWDLITDRASFKVAYINAKLAVVGHKSDARRLIIEGINSIPGMNINQIELTDNGTVAANKINQLINNANAPAVNALNEIYNNAIGVVATGGRRKSQSKQSPKRSGKSPKQSQQKKGGKSPKQSQQKGGNYYLNVDASKIGGLAEVTRIDQPLAPEASTFNKYPEPLYLKDLSNPTTVNGMANSVNVATAPTTGQTAGAKKEYMFVTNKRTGQPMKVRKSPKQMQQMNNKNMQVRVLKQQGGVEGEQSVYTGDMMQRDFSGKQPEWSPKVI